MVIGIGMFLGFLIVAFIIITKTNDFFKSFQEWLNNEFNLQIKEIGLLNFILAAPFLLFSFVVFAIVILTQRTPNINRKLNFNNRKTKKLVKKDKAEKSYKKIKKE